MSGIGLVLNAAKDALLTQQYAIDVISHNVTNINTEGYTKQTPVIVAKPGESYAGFLFGRGVELSDIVSSTNSFIESRLQNSLTGYNATAEKQQYMTVLESVFSENSGWSLSNQLNELWNAWNGLANNPSALPERNILSESGTTLARTFNNIYTELKNMGMEIGNSMEIGLGSVNQLISQIADVNQQILSSEVGGTANDLRDQRTHLVGKLAEYMDISSFEYTDGSISVTTGKGYLLVSKDGGYSLGYDGNDISWQTSGNKNINITDTIVGGKLGGLLDIRDEILPKYMADLDELAKSIVWEINSAHSQGVGLNGFSSVTGAYQVLDSSEEMGAVDSGLDYYDKITDGSFKVWLYDGNGSVVGEASIHVHTNTDSLADLVSTLDSISIGGEDALNASISGNNLYLEIDQSSHPDYTFAFSDDTSNVLAALGVNTFFESANARDVSVNDVILGDKNFINAAVIHNNVDSAVADSGNSSTGFITTSGPYTGSTDSVYTVTIDSAGSQAFGSATFSWSKDGIVGGSGIAAGASVLLGTEGVAVTFSSDALDTYDNSDSFSINVEASSDTYGDYTSGDNTNALNISNLQYEDVSVKRWTYERGNSPTSSDVTGGTIDDYLHVFLSSVGIQSQSIQREAEYTQAIMGQFQELRDNLSGVSLDEEMASLIKYQHAYSAAAKLVLTANEMFETILELR